MIIEITMKPMFWLGLLRRDVETLMKLSANHYDGHCRQVGKPGGFLYGWHNTALDQDRETEYKAENVPKCGGSARDLDTILKICEGTRLASNSGVITLDEHKRMCTLCSMIIMAADTGAMAAQTTQLQPITEPTAQAQQKWATAPGRY